ncbi:hypothetical protein H4219_004486 [Mycoemilia scoparia]|uniref:SHSP domain-containing protein n=1 Tax=Mycoemilia scoparia TaxID=417184 RepID=A0A9W7ZS88_9FUNG|nr:hypothetical protein H4219_004486 [Mycoemilia scoparia]
MSSGNKQEGTRSSPSPSDGHQFQKQDPTKATNAQSSSGGGGFFFDDDSHGWFSSISPIERSLENIFNHFTGGNSMLFRHPLDHHQKIFGTPSPYSAFSLTSSSLWSPRVDINETDKDYKISVDIPGVNKEDVRVDIKNDQLRIQGETKNPPVTTTTTTAGGEEGGVAGGWRVRERSWGKFQRSITLPRDIDQSKIEANVKNGVLRICVPKNMNDKPRAISIS